MITCTRLSAYAVSASPTAASAAPAMISGSRPQRSHSRPTTGRASKAVPAYTPNAIPASPSEPPSGPVTSSGRAKIAMPLAVKYASSATDEGDELSGQQGFADRECLGHLRMVGRPKPAGMRASTQIPAGWWRSGGLDVSRLTAFAPQPAARVNQRPRQSAAEPPWREEAVLDDVQRGCGPAGDADPRVRVGDVALDGAR